MIWLPCQNPGGQDTIVQRLIRLDAQTGEVLATTEAGADREHCRGALSPDGRWLLTGGESGRLTLWEGSTLSDPTEAGEVTAQVVSVAIGPDNRTAAVGALDGRVTLFDLETRQETGVIDAHEDDVRGLAFSPDGSLLLSGSFDGSARLWRLADRSLVHRFGHEDRIWQGVDISPDGRLAVTASGPQKSDTATAERLDATIRLWDLDSGAEVRRIDQHRSTVYDVKFTPDGRWLISTSLDGTLRVWSVDSGREVRRYLAGGAYHLFISVAPDGTWAASTSTAQRAMQAWDLADLGR